MPSCKPTKKPGDAEPSPIKFENGVSHFKFSPKDNIIAVWSPHSGDIPARLSLVNIETRHELQTKSRTNFSAVMEWQSEGDYLCIILSKLTKAEKNAKADKEKKDDERLPERPAMKNAKKLEIFRMREKNIPVESVDVDDVIKGFFWEPRSNRFALLTESASSSKTNIMFFSLTDQKCENVCQFELPSSAYNKVFWAPDGQYFVVAAVGQTGELMWGRLTLDNQIELLFKDEQYNLTNVEWDSSSRFVITSVVQSMQHASTGASQDAGYTIWTFQGRMVHKQMLEKLYYAAWRPHPPSYLQSDEEREIRKNLKTHSKKFDRADDIAKDKAKNEVREKKDKKIREFRDKMESLEQRFLEHARQPNIGWAEAWEKFDEEHRWKDVTEPVEEVIEVKEEQIDF